MKFAISHMRQYPPYLKHVATLPWEIKHSNCLQIFSRYGRKRKQIAFLITSNWLQIIFFLSIFFYLLTFTINLWHRKYVSANVTAVFVNKTIWYSATRTRIWWKVCIWRGTQQRGSQTNFLRKARQSVVLIGCWKSCGTQAQHSWQTARQRQTTQCPQWGKRWDC